MDVNSTKKGGLTMRKLVLALAFAVCLLSFTIGTIDADAGGLMFSEMPPCQKILLNPGNDSFPFLTGYRCKGFAEGLPFQNECVCYRATGNPTVFSQFLADGCTNEATCACDGFLDNFNNSPIFSFLCDGEGFAYKGHLFLLWIPKIDVKGIFNMGDTANLVCFPDDSCQNACDGCQ
jgi:hypothetical protein